VGIALAVRDLLAQALSDRQEATAPSLTHALRNVYGAVDMDKLLSDKDNTAVLKAAKGLDRVARFAAAAAGAHDARLASALEQVGGLCGA
jgi:regulator of protease activity HflC (stomatin/prohibitin superfamily)